jgi:hypothetical protein
LSQFGSLPLQLFIGLLDHPEKCQDQPAVWRHSRNGNEHPNPRLGLSNLHGSSIPSLLALAHRVLSSLRQQGNPYGVSRIINVDSSLNLEAYKAYSPLFSTFAIAYNLSFAAITAIVVYKEVQDGW